MNSTPTRSFHRIAAWTSPDVPRQRPCWRSWQSSSSGRPSGSTPSDTRRPTPAAGSPSCCSPPASFHQALGQCVRAVQVAVERGERLLEVDFPPLSAEVLASPRLSADELIDANTRLALEFCKRLIDADTAGAPSGGATTERVPLQRAAVLLPDMIERNRAVSQHAAALLDMMNPEERHRRRIRLAVLRSGHEAGNLFQRLLRANTKGDGGGALIEAVQDDDDWFVVVAASSQELPEAEQLVERVRQADRHRAHPRPVILFNVQLDMARADLGLPAFPSKALHDRFLSHVLPVYYLRNRTYTKSLSRPPYLIQFQGALFRAYPEPYQMLLDTGNGAYRPVANTARRPTMREFRETLTAALQLDEPQRSSPSPKNLFGLLRRSDARLLNWWEREDAQRNASDKWRQ